MLAERITLNPHASFGSYELGWRSLAYTMWDWCHSVSTMTGCPQTTAMPIPSGTMVLKAGSHLVSLVKTACYL